MTMFANPWLYLILAIVFEVVGTTSLKLAEGFTRFWPSMFVVLGYGLAFYLVGLSLKHIPLGTAYAIWSGVGTAATVMIGVWLWQESIDPIRLLGIGLIIGGVVILQFFTRSAA
jgi:multidrug transporter EmrE-like cation transporter